MAQPSPLSPAWQRARALVDSGDLAGARAVLERAVELGRVNLSEDDPDVLRTSYQLAAVHQLADDPSAARRVLEEAYAAGQWRLGDADPLMLEISHDIGVVAEELGNRHEARKAFGRVAEFGPSVLGAQHRAITRARAYLGQDQSPFVRPQGVPQPQGAARPEDAPQPVPPPWAGAAPQAGPPGAPPEGGPPSQAVPAAQAGPAQWADPQPGPWVQAAPYAQPAPPQGVRPQAHGALSPGVEPQSHGALSPGVEPQATAGPPLQAAPQAQWADPHADPPRQAAARTPPVPAARVDAQDPAAPPAQAIAGMGAEAGPSTPYDVPRQGWSPAQDPHRDRPPAQTPGQGPGGSSGPEQRTAQMGATPPAAEGTTNVFGAVPRPSGLVQPPSPANQHVWTGPVDRRPGPIDEATVAHPVITPRGGAEGTYGSGMVPEPLVVTRPYEREAAPRPYEKRGFGLFAAIAAVLAAVIAVAALVFVLANRGDDRPSDPNVPTLGGNAPTSVRLRDEGSKISITWQDPSAGTVSFMVAMGHPGEQLKPVATLGPGQTSYEMGALNTSLNYCFTVIAVYRGNQFATSTQACTDRPAPSTSK